MAKRSPDTEDDGNAKRPDNNDEPLHTLDIVNAHPEEDPISKFPELSTTSPYRFTSADREIIRREAARTFDPSTARCVDAALGFQGVIAGSANPLNIAIECRNLETARYFLSKYPFAATWSDRLQKFPLHYCKDGNSFVLIPLLKDAGANIDARNGDGITALEAASLRPRSSMIIATLVANGASVDMRPDSYQKLTPLMHAIRGGDESNVASLVSVSPLDARDPEGKTALMHAVLGGNRVILALLIAAKSPLDAQDAKKKTALMHAAEKPDHIAISLLLTAGANPELTDNLGRPAIDYPDVGSCALAFTLRQTCRVCHGNFEGCTSNDVSIWSGNLMHKYCATLLLEYEKREHKKWLQDFDPRVAALL